ncbi:MAG: cupin domain-containing protein [Solirubrobacteraceae bacterium]
MATSRQSQPSLQDGVGRHLRRLRRRRGLTLAAVAASASTSESFLSQLERGQTGASLDTIARLAHALGIKVADLFEPDHTREPVVLRARERPVLHVWHLGSKELLTPRSSEHLEVFVCRLEPGGSTGERPYTHGDSEELFLVLDGEVELELGPERHRLRTGDSITYRSSAEHRVTNLGDDVAEGLWIISPPSF